MNERTHANNHINRNNDDDVVDERSKRQRTDTTQHNAIERTLPLTGRRRGRRARRGARDGADDGERYARRIGEHDARRRRTHAMQLLTKWSITIRPLLITDCRRVVVDAKPISYRILLTTRFINPIIKHTTCIVFVTSELSCDSKRGDDASYVVV